MPHYDCRFHNEQGVETQRKKGTLDARLAEGQTIMYQQVPYVITKLVADWDTNWTHLVAARLGRDVKTTAVWDALLGAHRSAHRGGMHGRGRRDGLLQAYALITGQDEETVYEELQDVIIGEAEGKFRAPTAEKKA